MKKTYASTTHRPMVDPWEAAVCASIAGGIAAAITTPLDVVKTRVMLSQKNPVGAGGAPSSAYYSGIVPTFKRILAEEGPRALFSGVGPRVMWISIGGSIFLGVYEKVKVLVTKHDL